MITLISIITKNKSMKAIAIAAPIQSGDNTHHQFQSIFPVNFNTTKIMVKSVLKPIPPLLLEFAIINDFKNLVFL